MLRTSLMERSTTLFPSSGSSPFLAGDAGRGKLFFKAAGSAAARSRRARWSTASRGGVVAAAISERMVKVAPVEVQGGEKPVQFKVRASVTLKRIKGVDWKEAIVDKLVANPLEAIGERLGNNVVLELVSTDVDPSMLSSSP